MVYLKVCSFTGYRYRRLGFKVLVMAKSSTQKTYPKAPEDFDKLLPATRPYDENDILFNIRHNINVDPTANIYPNVHIGDNVGIGAYAIVKRDVGNDVQIGDYAIINAPIGDRTTIGAHTHVYNGSIICNNASIESWCAIIGASILSGAKIGKGCIIGSALIECMATIQDYSHIGDGVTIDCNENLKKGFFEIVNCKRVEVSIPTHIQRMDKCRRAS